MIWHYCPTSKLLPVATQRSHLTVGAALDDVAALDKDNIGTIADSLRAPAAAGLDALLN